MPYMTRDGLATSRSPSRGSGSAVEFPAREPNRGMAVSSAGIPWVRPDAPATRQRQLLRVAAGVFACALVTVVVWARPQGWLGAVGVAVAALAAGVLAFRALRLGHNAADTERRLDELIRESAESRRRLEEANTELRARNSELLALHIAFAELLNLADERSDGRMRMLIESTGTELAELLERQIDGHARLEWPDDGAQRAAARK